MESPASPRPSKQYISTPHPLSYPVQSHRRAAALRKSLKWVRCCRHIHADVIAIQMVGDIAARRAGQKRNRLSAPARILNQQRFTEGTAVVRKYGIGYLFNARIKRPEHRNITQQRFPPLHQRLADVVLREQTDGKNKRDGQKCAEPRQMKTEQTLRLPGFRE